MPVDGQILFSLLACAGLVKLALLQSDKAREIAALREARKTTIESFEEGKPAKIVGVLSYLGEPLQAPLTGRPCACYEIYVEQFKTYGNLTLGRWKTIIHEVRGHDFVLDDGTGRAIVDPAKPDVVITIDSRTASGASDKPNFRARELLKSHGVSHKGWIFDKELRYREGILEVGELVAVMGHATREPDPDGATRVTGYREGPPMRLRFRSSRKAPLVISDDEDLLA